MSNILKYKGYWTKVKLSLEDGVLYGKIEGISDNISYEAKQIKDVKNKFEAAVDDYLLLCKELGKEPDKEYNGVFNVRISADSHKDIARKAGEKGKSINSLMQEAVDYYLEKENAPKMKYSIKGSDANNNKVVFFEPKSRLEDVE